MSSAHRGFGQHSPGKLVCASMASNIYHPLPAFYFILVAVIWCSASVTRRYAPPPCSRPVPSTTKKSPDRSRIPVDIPSRWEPPWPYGLHLLIFPQPLGRALKNQNAAPTTPPCFCRRQRSSSLLFESCTVHHKKIPRPNGLGILVDGTGLEPVTSCTSSRCSTS